MNEPSDFADGSTDGCPSTSLENPPFVPVGKHTISTMINPLPHMPILGSSNSAPNKGMMSKTRTNGGTIIWLSRKHNGKRRNCSLRAISLFPTMFLKALCS